jgi:creatinine amidohydrolase/Fe(II)-dependent formamide hydrolase-like protein
VIHDPVGSLYRHGWRKVYVLTGHGGNNATVEVAVTRLRDDLADPHIAWAGSPRWSPTWAVNCAAPGSTGTAARSRPQAMYVDKDLVLADPRRHRTGRSRSGRPARPPDRRVSAWCPAPATRRPRRAAHRGRGRCAPTPRSTDIGADVVKFAYVGRARHASVGHYRVIGGGHSWPGATVHNGPGVTTSTISATRIMWRFFLGHPLRH